ncbi:MAG TPA: CRISPR-associated helicase Cas3' [Candidatus Hydrogenedentes bacterium]|nr:CRISPR-associated helicase Cas3' [Candidatus Hydrogenedentota bacterium]HPG70017.1 CRISPR-associated helicase Cas3' [Candidatus Hydrogenedentota bacterium]
MASFSITSSHGRDPFYAHSVPGRPQDQWQILDEHLRNVAETAAHFGAEFDSADWAYNAGWLHDVGKAEDAFQAYLARENDLDDSDYDHSGLGRVNHSSAGGALSADGLAPSAGRVLAYLAAGHHAGLPDWYPCDTGNAALQIRLDEGRRNLSRIEPYAAGILAKLRSLSRPPGFVTPKDCHFWIRMLYSCLVDADYLDTEAFMSPASHQNRLGFKTLEDLKPAFDRHMAQVAANARTTPVNVTRQEVLAACRAAALETPGVFSLTVPTGGGKTLSATAFALDHAIKHGKRRIIYVIPYTSIIEQTAHVLAGIFGPENVVEHHSNLDPSEESHETQRARLAAENWDAPIIVTTNVQFFESLYAAKSSRCRKLHNIANSVVILDEAQLLPPNLLSPCVDALNTLTRGYGVTLVLSTATQPALPSLDRPREIIPEPARLYSDLKRTEISFPPSLSEPSDWQSVAAQLQEHRQVLCVVNTRRDCYELFKLMPEGTIHLSALMCGFHRSQAIKRIKQSLKNGEAIRVISTQLVEAGVDIDFPVVYRALAGLDSVAQAAGRCNREGLLNAEGRLGQVHVFVPPKPAPRGLLHKGEATTVEMAALADFDIENPQTFTCYFELFYSKVNDTAGSRLHDQLVKDANPDLMFHFRTAAAEFKLIDDQAQRPVFVRFGNSDALLEQLRIIGPTREIMRKLQRFTVNLSTRMADRMMIDGLLEEIRPGFLAQGLSSLYSPLIGLDIFRETLPVEDLMV